MFVVGSGIVSHPGDAGVAEVATTVGFHAGWFVHDVVLTWEEYQGLMAGLLAPQGSSTGETRLSTWLAANREHLGARYASEVARHYALTPPPSFFRKC